MTEPLMPINRQEERQRYRLRSRGLLGRMLILLLQPAAFFRSLPSLQESLDWFWIGLLILIVMVLGASHLSNNSILLSDNNTSALWTNNLLALSKTILLWITQAVLLYLIVLSGMKRPHWGLCIRIAIWSSIPLALMVLVQMLYLSNGGTMGKPGVTGLLLQWPAYSSFAPNVQKFMLALVSNLTLFTLWNLLLLYFGARNALKAKTWAILLGILLWIVLSTITSVAVV